MPCSGLGNAEASITLHYVVVPSGVLTAAKVTSYLVRCQLHMTSMLSDWLSPFQLMTCPPSPWPTQRRRSMSTSAVSQPPNFKDSMQPLYQPSVIKQ